MSAKIKTLFDKVGNKLYPKTKVSAVYDDNDQPLDITLNEYIKAINEQGTTQITDPDLHRSDIEQVISESTTKVPSTKLLKDSIEEAIGQALTTSY